MVNREPEYLRTEAIAYVKNKSVGKERVALLKSLESSEVLLSGVSSKGKSRTPKSRRTKIPARVYGETGGRPYDFSCSWPLQRDQCWLSSGFGPRKRRDGSWKFHYGLDMAAAKGTPVTAAREGRVSYAGWQKGYGKFVTIEHERGYATRYAHLNSIIVSHGAQVAQGQKIGTVGATGFVRSRWGKDPSHLHFEVTHYTRRVNPLYVLV